MKKGDIKSMNTADAVIDKSASYTLLSNGYVVDGSGNKGFKGNVLLKDGIIQEISEREIVVEGKEIDCEGKVIAPGFIDIHSHNDWFFPSDQQEQFIDPFIRQGITTFITGNCGFSAAGFKKGTQYMDKIKGNVFKAGNIDFKWSSMSEYFDYLEHKKIIANIAMMVGHGTTRTSVRGYDADAMQPKEMDEILYLLDEAMEQGAAGVSFGLQYEPGIFASQDEILQIAGLVKRRNKIITVHARALSALSGTYPIRPFGTPHNIIALQELLNIARKTGVRLQFSHLIFVGEKTWKTYERCFKMIEDAIDDGVDIMFDTYAYSCGASIITVILPEWFMAKVPEVYDDSKALKKLRFEISLIEKFLGFGFKDIQITYANHPKLNNYNGRFIHDIAEERGLTPIENYLDFVKKSGGEARVLQYRYSNQQIVEALMRHPASLFMTDAWIETTGVQNPSCFGCYPRFLQLAREKSILSLEESVHKMTGASADRVGIKDRGRLKKGWAADVTVFDWHSIKDNTSVNQTDKAPDGIEHVFINGVHVLKEGKMTNNKAGKVIKIV